MSLGVLCFTNPFLFIAIELYFNKYVILKRMTIKPLNNRD